MSLLVKLAMAGPRYATTAPSQPTEKMMCAVRVNLRRPGVIVVRVPSVGDPIRRQGTRRVRRSLDRDRRTCSGFRGGARLLLLVLLERAAARLDLLARDRASDRL